MGLKIIGLSRVCPVSGVFSAMDNRLLPDIESFAKVIMSHLRKVSICPIWPNILGHMAIGPYATNTVYGKRDASASEKTYFTPS